MWEKVTGAADGGGGSLCLDCFVEKAEKKGIKVTEEDFTVNVFIPED